MNSRSAWHSPLMLGALIALLAWPATNHAQVVNSYSGDAVAASGKNGGITFDVDHLTLPSAGGSLSLSDPLPQSIPGGGCVGNCSPGEGGPIFLSTVGSGASTLSTAEVDQLNVVVGSHTITATVAANEASASCPVRLGDKALVASSGFVLRVIIDDTFDSSVSFPGGITDSQTFPLGPGGADGTVSVNQVASSTATSTVGDIAVNGLQIETASGDLIVIASSHAGVTCARAPSGGGCMGKVTGGGVFMLNGTRQTFGFVAGTKKDGTSFGNFNYVNHGTGAHLEGTVQGVSIDTAASTATITGTLKSGDLYTLVVTDPGEPGRADTFNLISAPLNTGGAIALDPRGGNIQIHKGCGGGGPA